jgi:hypothetical protein
MRGGPTAADESPMKFLAVPSLLLHREDTDANPVRLRMPPIDHPGFVGVVPTADRRVPPRAWFMGGGISPVMTMARGKAGPDFYT